MHAFIFILVLSLFAVRAVVAEEEPKFAPYLYKNAIESDFIIKDYRFKSGESLPEVRIHYRTIGTPKRDADGRITNAVLLLHGGLGGGLQFFAREFSSGLLRWGQALGPERYYVIAPDSIGCGRSSKPSDGLRMKFPRYTSADAVDLQHRLITEGLGVTHLRLLLGGRAGGRHAWLWATQWPDFMDVLVPIGCQPTPERGGQLLLSRATAIAITSDPEWRNGDYSVPPPSMLSMIAVGEMFGEPVENLERLAPNISSADGSISASKDFARKKDANDWLYAMDEFRDYDPEPNLPNVRARVLAVNFADDGIFTTAPAVLERSLAEVPDARSVMLPTIFPEGFWVNFLRPDLWATILDHMLRADDLVGTWRLLFVSPEVYLTIRPTGDSFVLECGSEALEAVSYHMGLEVKSGQAQRYAAVENETGRLDFLGEWERISRTTSTRENVLKNGERDVGLARFIESSHRGETFELALALTPTGPRRLALKVKEELRLLEAAKDQHVVEYGLGDVMIPVRKLRRYLPKQLRLYKSFNERGGPRDALGNPFQRVFTAGGWPNVPAATSRTLRPVVDEAFWSPFPIEK